jgi:hypothetical protein
VTARAPTTSSESASASASPVPCKKRHSFWRVPYVCPEPVLVK